MTRDPYPIERVFIAASRDGNYDYRKMERERPRPRSPEWFRRDAERNERARLERLRIDARKSIGQNIEEGAALIALGFEVQRAFGPLGR